MTSPRTLGELRVLSETSHAFGNLVSDCKNKRPISDEAMQFYAEQAAKLEGLATGINSACGGQPL